MAEDSDQEKTEPPSPRRLEKAREEGQVARSRELGSFMAIAAGVASLWFGAGHIYRTLNGVLRSALWVDPEIARDTQTMLDMTAYLAWQGLLLLLPIFGVLALASVFSSVALGGFLLSPKALELKFERLDFIKGIGRMFAAQALIELLKTLAKAALIGTVGVMVIWHYRGQMLSLMRMAPSEALVYGLKLVALCCLLITVSLIIVVVIDVPWQIWNHHKQLRMSHEDVKQENKESEGNPEVKGRIRQQQRAMARGRMMSAVPDADVVVTNPTHYAVALVYREGQGGAPTVVAKGSGFIAAKIRTIAAEHRVPSLEAPPLARALYHHVELNHEIPAELYAAVAEILAWVYQLRNWDQGAGTPPATPQHLAVPPELDPDSRAHSTMLHST